MFFKAIERIKSTQANQKGKQQFLAMYSSIFGGITTDPAVMVIPMDDHMIHRGHGVFDTAAICNGLVNFASKQVLPFDFCLFYSKHRNCNFETLLSCFLL